MAGEQARTIYNSFSFTTEEKDKIEVLKAKFKSYCEPRTNLTYIRHQFFTRTQGPLESTDAFVADLKNKAKDCKFEGLTESLIKDRIVCGIRSDEVRSRLLRDPKLDLQTAIDTCRASESTAIHMKSMKEDTAVAVRSIRNPSTSKYKKQSTKQGYKPRKSSCFNCGGDHPKDRCPTFGTICSKCNKRNHYASVCRSKIHRNRKEGARKFPVHGLEEDQDGDNNFFIGSLTREESDLSKQDWFVSLLINDKNVNFKIDSGAECNVISKASYQSIRQQHLMKSKARLIAFGGQKLTPCGKAVLACRYKNKYHAIEFCVVNQNVPNVVGLPTSMDLNLIQHVMELTQDIKSEYANILMALAV